MTETSILDYTPKGYKLRPEQKRILEKVESGYKNGTKVFMISAPVGSGKSLIAMTLQSWLGDAFVLTPRISLQNQYAREFGYSKKLVGRSHYPCTYQDKETNNYVIPLIKRGNVFKLNSNVYSCAVGNCTKVSGAKKEQVLIECSKTGICPYLQAIDTASESEAVVANYHSFVAQTKFRADMFRKRDLIVIDEAHTLASSLRSQLSVGFTINRMVAPKEIEHLQTLDQWCAWLRRCEQVDTFKKFDDKEEYLTKIDNLESTGIGVYGENLITKFRFGLDEGINEKFGVEITPYNVGGACRKLIYDLADVVVLMSGTWYGKDISCRELGLQPEDVNYIEVESGFDVKNRPVFVSCINDDEECFRKLDLSHKYWSANMNKLTDNLNVILDRHKGEKGLIHTTSYSKAWDIVKNIKNKRVIVHSADNFQEKMDEFLASKDGVLISPSCYEGVDLHDDKCRFNIITTLPYPSATEGFFKRLLDNNGWLLYNTITMRQIGQALGRGVRHEQDYCHSYLIDQRFVVFLNKIRNQIPNWLKDSFIYNF